MNSADKTKREGLQAMSSDTVKRPGWPLPMKIAFACFAAIAAFFLLTEHLAHTLGALPYLLILLCPVMHMFMHHGSDHMSGNSLGPSDGGK